MNGIKAPCYDFTVRNMDKILIKKVAIVVIPVIILIGLVIYSTSSFQTNTVPVDFIAARQKASIVSQDIVNLTTETGKKISEANQAEMSGNTEQLLGFVNDAKNSNSSAYQKAFDLSQILQQMAGALNNVQSNKQELGYEAVALELSLVSEFISYTQNLNSFLDILTRSALNNTPNSQKEIKDSLERVNQKAILINNLNKNFIDKMTAFDQAS